MSQSSRSKLHLHLRPAHQDDLPRLTSILIASFPADPEWVYRYPYAAQHPEDHYKYTFQRVCDYFENTTRGAAEMIVAEAGAEADTAASSAVEATVQKADRREILGFAVWQMPGSHDWEGSVEGRDMRFPAIPAERRDAHQAHVKAYFGVMYDKKTRMFDVVYGQQQAHLCLLGVDPAWQGYGAGGLLVDDGIAKAKAGGYALTLFATGPGGRRLYAKNGFKETEWIKVGPVEGEDEVIEFPGMVWKGSDAC